MTVFVEDFEGLTVTTNSPLQSAAFLQIGFLSAFTFPSGARLVEPIPNADGPKAVVVGDFARDPGADWTLIGPVLDGSVNAAGDLPSGTAYLGIDNDTVGRVAFSFNAPVFSVGAFVNSEDEINLTAYDAAGRVISGGHITMVATADWDESFITVSSKVPIAKVVFTGGYLVMDDLTFDTDKPATIKGTGDNDQIGSGALKGGPTNAAELILTKNGNDTVFAGGGDDTVMGGSGNDKLHGGAGNDALIGGKGNDKMFGDEGQDSFLMGPFGNIDTLKGFNPFEDTILLPKAIFSGLTLGFLDPAQFTNLAPLIDPTDRIIYNPSTGALSYDIDGNGAIAAVQFAKLPTGLTLDGSEFFVV